jgi:malate dehydrogenase (oxaloacetate-decarboxylating)(NADP+)
MDYPFTSDGLSPWGTSLPPRGTALLTDPLLNKGTAFTERERDALGLRGLLPPRVFSIEEQVKRSLAAIRRKSDALEKYIYITNLQNRNEVLFYRLVLDNLEEMIPLIYTPTVGEACLQYGAIFRRPRGLFLTIRESGRIAEILRLWPREGVRLIVVTDGERILRWANSRSTRHAPACIRPTRCRSHSMSARTTRSCSKVIFISD